MCKEARKCGCGCVPAPKRPSEPKTKRNAKKAKTAK